LSCFASRGFRQLEPGDKSWRRGLEKIETAREAAACHSHNFWSFAFTSENQKQRVKIQKKMRLVSLEIPEFGATGYQTLMRQNPDLTRSGATRYRSAVASVETAVAATLPQRAGFAPLFSALALVGTLMTCSRLFAICFRPGS
jgi:hypothetical protein